jgi:hypothetical protein
MERAVDRAGLGMGAESLVDDGLEAGRNGDGGRGRGQQREQRGGDLPRILGALAPDHPQGPQLAARRGWGLLRRGGGRLGGAGRDGSWRGSAMAQPPSPWRAPLEGGLVPSQPVVRRESTGRPPGPSRGVSGRFVLRRGHVDLVALQPEQLTGTIMVNARYGRPGARSAQWPGMMAPYRLYTFRVYTLAVIGLAHSGSMRWAPGVHGNLSQAMSS